MKRPPRVTCDCDGVRISGVYEVDGDWLVLKSTVGDLRVRLGISNPHKLASKLMKNVCMKAIGRSKNVALQSCCSTSISGKANRLVDLQRDRVEAMAASDAQRPAEELILDQIVANARSVEEASYLLDPSSCSPNTPIT